MSTATPAPASSCWDDADPPGRAASARTVDVPGSLRLATAERATQTYGCDERLSAIQAAGMCRTSRTRYLALVSSVVVGVIVRMRSPRIGSSASALAPGL